MEIFRFKSNNKKNIKNLLLKNLKKIVSHDTDLIKDFDHNKIYIQDGKLIKDDFSYEKEKSLKLNIEEIEENKINTNSLLNLNSALSEDNISINRQRRLYYKCTFAIYNNYSE